jgi:lysophospholipase L1-like esterase
LADFSQYCRNGSLNVRNYRILVVHFGTNDLRADEHFTKCAERIVASLDRALTFIQSVNPLATLAVSGILPRPKDLKAENVKMMEARIYANVSMKAFCEDRGIEYLTSETFLSSVDAKEVVLYEDDGIHLTPDGAYLFQNFLEGKIGELLGISYLEHPRAALIPRPPSPDSSTSASRDKPSTSGNCNPKKRR